MIANKGQLNIGGVICRPDGTIKTAINLNADVPVRLRRRFVPLPCELTHDTAARNAMCDALVDLFDVGSTNASGRIVLQTTGGITLLATIIMAIPAFGPSVFGVAPGLTLPWSDQLAVGDGLASEFIAMDRDENVIMTGDVAISGAEMNFPQTEIAVNDIVKLLSVSYTAPP